MTVLLLSAASSCIAAGTAGSSLCALAARDVARPWLGGCSPPASAFLLMGLAMGDANGEVLARNDQQGGSLDQRDRAKSGMVRLLYPKKRKRENFGGK
jgi:hypothetical protein